MSKYNIGDEVWVKGIINGISTDELFDFRVKLEDGDEIWFDEKNLCQTPTCAKNAQVKSKWFEVEDENGEKRIINIDKIISLNADIMCVTLEECYQYELTKESYQKLKERLMEE